MTFLMNSEKYTPTARLVFNNRRRLRLTHTERGVLRCGRRTGSGLKEPLACRLTVYLS